MYKCFLVFLHRYLTNRKISKGKYVRKVYYILFAILLLCFSCEWRMKPNGGQDSGDSFLIDRYDRIESLFLLEGDYAALQQMQADYPSQTRILIEDVLNIGKVNDTGINHKFRLFFNDSTLQRLLADVQHEYADMEDVQRDLTKAFILLKKQFPAIEIPHVVYTQIGAFDQSIVVDGDMLGISLDKYMGEDYPFYLKHYPLEERQLMKRSMIVPDCIAFYILSHYPSTSPRPSSLSAPHIRRGKIQWTVNRVLKRKVFVNKEVDMIDDYMKRHHQLSMEDLLLASDTIV